MHAVIMLSNLPVHLTHAPPDFPMATIMLYGYNDFACGLRLEYSGHHIHKAYRAADTMRMGYGAVEVAVGYASVQSRRAGFTIPRFCAMCHW